MNILGSVTNGSILLLNDDFYNFGFPEHVIKQVEKASKSGFVSNNVYVKCKNANLDFSTSGMSIKTRGRAEFNMQECLPQLTEEDVVGLVTGLDEEVEVTIPKGTANVRATVMFINKDISITLTDTANNSVISTVKSKIKVVRGVDVKVLPGGIANLVITAFIKENLTNTQLADFAVTTIKKIASQVKVAFKQTPLEQRHQEIMEKVNNFKYVVGKPEVYKEVWLIDIRELYEEYYTVLKEAAEYSLSGMKEQPIEYPIYRRPRGAKKLRSA